MKRCMWMAVLVLMGAPAPVWGQVQTNVSDRAVSGSASEAERDNFARIKISDEQQEYVQEQYRQMLGELKEKGVVDPIRQAAQAARTRPAVSSGVRQVRFDEPHLVPRPMTAPRPLAVTRPETVEPKIEEPIGEPARRLYVDRKPVRWNEERIAGRRSYEMVQQSNLAAQPASQGTLAPPSARPIVSSARTARQEPSPFSQSATYGQLPIRRWRQDPFADPPTNQQAPRQDESQPTPAQNPFADPPQDESPNQPNDVPNPFADPMPKTEPPQNQQPQELPPVVQPPQLPQLGTPTPGLPPIVQGNATGTGCGTDAGCGTDSGVWDDASQVSDRGCGVDSGCGVDAGSVGTGTFGFRLAASFGKRGAPSPLDCVDCGIEGTPIHKPSMYYSVFGGVAQVDDFLATTPTSGLAGSYYFDDAFAIGVAAGQVLSSHLRTEVEFSYRSHDLYQFDLLSSTNTVALNASGETKVYSGMANMYWEFVNFPLLNAKPYIGAGLGFASVESDFQIGTTSLLSPGYDKDSALAYQWMAGLNWCTAPNMSLFVEYRYFATDGIRLESNLGGPVPGLFDYRSDNIFAGIRFKF